MPEPKPAHFAAYWEIVQASERSDLEAAISSPDAAVIELAKLLHRFDDQITDDDRALIIAIGGGLHRLSGLIAADNIADEIRRG